MIINTDEAEHAAAYELRFNIGNIPHLSDPVYNDEENVYIFEIRYTRPDLSDAPFDSHDEMKFYQTQTVGEMRVYEDGHIERTSNEEIEAAIRDVKEKTDAGEIPHIE